VGKPSEIVYNLTINNKTMDMDFREFDGELTPDKLDEMETSQLAIRLFSNYIKDLGIWIKILWAIITRYFLVILCVATYIVMLRFQPTRMILIGLYIFFAIFWSFFPYAFKCVLIYKITSISYCVHTIIYAVIGLICWIIALGMYNTAEYERAKALSKQKFEEVRQMQRSKSKKKKDFKADDLDDLFRPKDDDE
jgi:hypothetical protein